MMKFEINIPDDEIKQAILNEVASCYSSSSLETVVLRRTTAECVREIIYKEEAEIIDRIVAQASRECKNKAIKKILEGLE